MEYSFLRRSRKDSLFATKALGMVLGAYLPTAAHAQSSQAAIESPAASDTLSAATDIIVTATRREERLSKVPIAVTVVSEDALAKASILSVSDLPQVASGVKMVAVQGASDYLLPYIRGVGSPNGTVGNDPSVALYIDGVYQPVKTANYTDFNDIERVEVLKGPQATLFGRNAAGGAISITTKRPSRDQLVGSLSASYGRYNEFIARAYVSSPLSETLSANFSGTYRNEDGYVDGVRLGTKLGGGRTVAASGKLDWHPEGDAEVTLSGFYTDKEKTESTKIGRSDFPPSGVRTSGGTVSYDLDKDFGTTSPRFAIQYGGVRMNIRYPLDFADIVSITGFQKGSFYGAADSDNTDANLVFVITEERYKSFSQELQVLSTTNGPFKWLLGASYQLDNQSVAPGGVGIGLASPGTPAQIAAGGTRRETRATSAVDAFAFYGQGSYTLGERTTLTGGLRYTIDKRGFEHASVTSLTGNGVGGINTTVLTAPDTSKTFRKLTWDLSLNHRITDELMVYSSYRRGFKSGVFNALAVSPTQPPLQPETLDSYEVGVKYSSPGRGINLSLSGFYYDWKNQQVLIVNQPLIIAQNAASSRIYGLDAEITVRASENFSIRGNVTLLNAKFKAFRNASAFSYNPVTGGGIQGAIPDASGTSLPYAPDVSFNVGPQIDLPLGGDSSLVIVSNVSYDSKFKNGLGDENFSRAYALINGTITYNINKKYYVQVFGRNIGDVVITGNFLNAYGRMYSRIQPATYGIGFGLNF